MSIFFNEWLQGRKEATSRYGVIFKMPQIYNMKMVATTVGGVRHFNPKMIMFLNRKYSMIWISLDADGSFWPVTLLYGLPVFYGSHGSIKKKRVERW